MNRSTVIAVILALGVGIGVGLLWPRSQTAEDHSTHPDEATASEDEDEVPATCSVRTVALVRGELPLPITAFGVVTVAPASSALVVAPYEGSIRSLVAMEGTLISGDATLVEITPSPETLAQRDEARLTRAASERDLALVQQRLELRLATAQELSQAQAVAELARLKAQTWEQRLAGGGRCNSVSANARVGKLLVQVGQLVPQGTPLVELNLVGGLSDTEIRVGLDPADAARLNPGQSVTVTALRRTIGAPLSLKLLRLAPQVTLESRLLDVIVSVPPDAALVPGEAVRAEIPLMLPDVLIVPRQALVRSDDGWAVFTAVEQKEEHHAVRHVVTLVAQNRTHAAIAVVVAVGSDTHENDLKPGDAVITEGNAEVAEGMALHILDKDAP